MPDNQDYHKRPPKPQTAHRPPWPCAESDSHPGSCLGQMSSLVDTSLTYFSEQQRPLPHFSLEVSLVSTSQVCSPEVPISMSLSLLFGGSNSIVSLPPLNWHIQSHLVPPTPAHWSLATLLYHNSCTRPRHSSGFLLPSPCLSTGQATCQSPHPGFSDALKLEKLVAAQSLS